MTDSSRVFNRNIWYDAAYNLEESIEKRGGAMRTLLAAIALAATAWACDAKAEPTMPVASAPADGPSYTLTVKIDDV